MTERPTIGSERVDDIPLLVAQMRPRLHQHRADGNAADGRLNSRAVQRGRRLLNVRAQAHVPAPTRNVRDSLDATR